VIVVVVALILCGLSNNGADARTRCSANDGALQAAAKDCAEYRATSSTNQRALPGTNPALVAAMVVVVRAIVIVVIAVAPTPAAAHAAIVSTIVGMLCERGNHRRNKEERKNENCISKLAHVRIDAKFKSREVVSSADGEGSRPMLQVIFIVLAVVAASIHLTVSPATRSSKPAIARTYLLYLLVIYVGLMGLLTAYAHVFRPIQTSTSIGWSTSPYEYEVGMADLTVGVLGILCIWFRGNFWLATAIANAVWLLGDAIGHTRQIAANNNHAANNSGIFLIAEIVTPIVIMVLALYTRNEAAKS
jgi:hypothetical protein